MSRQLPSSYWSSNTAQNEDSDSDNPRDGLPFRHNYPSSGYTSVSPSQVYHSSPSPQSTLPTVLAHQHASSFPGQPDPSSSGTVSHYPPYPTRYTSVSSSNPPPPMIQRATTMPMLGHPDIAPSMPYDMSTHHPSHSEMHGGPQPSSQTRSYLDANEGRDDWSGSSGGDLEQNPEGMNDLQRRSAISHPFAGIIPNRSRKPYPWRPKKGSPTPDQLPCRLCQKLSPRHIIEHFGGFCCERHRTQWRAVHEPDVYRQWQ